MAVVSTAATRDVGMCYTNSWKQFYRNRVMHWKMECLEVQLILLPCFVLLFANYHIVPQIGWTLCVMMFLSLSHP